MHSDEDRNEPDPKDLERKIKGNLLAALRTLHPLNLDISLYLHHHNENIHRNPFDGNGLDGLYTMYEDRVNECRRMWMKLRAASEKRASLPGAAGNSSASKPRMDSETSPSPLEYLSALGEDELAEASNGQVTPMDVDPVKVKREPSQSPAPEIGPRPPKSKPKKSDAPTPRGVIITPSGPTLCRLAPIPKGVTLSVETTRIPPPHKPFTFNMPQQYVVNDSERRPLNRTKRKNRDIQPSKDVPLPRHSLQSSSQQAGPSTAQTSISASPKKNYSSAKEYWQPRRAIRPTDFQMDKDRLFNSLDCLGPPFRVNMTDITHNDTPAWPSDLNIIYGGKAGLAPKISAEKLANHGFDHWLTPNTEFHPFLPGRPGWPGLILRPDEELEEWRPEGGTEFRVVVKREPRFIEYVGQYEMVRLGEITADEWKRQPAQVKVGWTKILGGGQSGNDIIARVALRKKLGKDPSTNDFAKYAGQLTPDVYAKLAKELKDDVDKAFCDEEEIIAVWGMKCVGYDYKFEKHLARSLKANKPSSSSSRLTKKRKADTKDADAMSEDEDEEEGEDSESEDSSPPKRQRVAKGKAKLVRYDWTDARFQGDSEDEDYKPA